MWRGHLPMNRDGWNYHLHVRAIRSFEQLRSEFLRDRGDRDEKRKGKGPSSSTNEL